MNKARTESGMARSSDDDLIRNTPGVLRDNAGKSENVEAPEKRGSTDVTEEYDEFVCWMAGERERGRREERRRLAERVQRSRQIRRRLAACLAVFLLMGMSFGAGQKLPPATCQQAFERLSHTDLLHVGTSRPMPIHHLAITNISARPLDRDESPARLQRLEQKFCDGCGKRLWPLMSSGEPCPYCQAREPENSQLVPATRSAAKRLD